MSELVWEEPPPAGRGPGAPSKYRPVAEELQKRPGEWARLNEPLPHQRYLGVLRRSPAFQPAHEWEMASRKLPDGSVAAYVRYVGNTETE